MKDFFQELITALISLLLIAILIGVCILAILGVVALIKVLTNFIW